MNIQEKETKCQDCDKLLDTDPRHYAESDCCACNGSGVSYWSDDSLALV